MNDNQKSGIGFFEKYLTLWVLLCMGIGVAISVWLPWIPHFLSQFERFSVCRQSNWADDLYYDVESQFYKHQKSQYKLKRTHYYMGNKLVDKTVYNVWHCISVLFCGV